MLLQDQADQLEELVRCTPFRSAPPTSCDGRVGWLTRRLVPVLAPALVVAFLGCREDAESPTGPEPTTAPATASTAQALSFRQVSAGGLHNPAA